MLIIYCKSKDFHCICQQCLPFYFSITFLRREGVDVQLPTARACEVHFNYSWPVWLGLKFPLAKLCRSCAAFPVHNSAVLREKNLWRCIRKLEVPLLKILSIKEIYQLKVSPTPVWLLSKGRFKAWHVEASKKNPPCQKMWILKAQSLSCSIKCAEIPQPVHKDAQ